MYVVKINPDDDRSWTWFNSYERAYEYGQRCSPRPLPELDLTKRP
ncbi:hypothetical protein ABZW02_25660 [Streptomyces sp. NPDC005180]